MKGGKRGETQRRSDERPSEQKKRVKKEEGGEIRAGKEGSFKKVAPFLADGPSSAKFNPEKKGNLVRTSGRETTHFPPFLQRKMLLEVRGHSETLRRRNDGGGGGGFM